MTKSGAGLLLGLLIALPLTAAEPTVGASSGQQSDQKALEEFRSDLQSVETEVISKTVTLTTDEAARFWPVFQRFQAEQKVIIDGQLAALNKYAASYEKLSDQDAVAYVNSLLERDLRIHNLRAKYLTEISKVLPPGKAARVIQINRRLGLVAQVKVATSIPLVR